LESTRVADALQGLSISASERSKDLGRHVVNYFKIRRAPCDQDIRHGGEDGFPVNVPCFDNSGVTFSSWKSLALRSIPAANAQNDPEIHPRASK
jgi:hypothetical protein